MDEKISITSKKMKKSTLLSLNGELTIYSANEAQKKLFGNFDDLSSSIELDLSQLQEIDTAGVQLLLFFKRQLIDANKQFYITKTSEQVAAVLSLLDLTQHFSLEAHQAELDKVEE